MITYRVWRAARICFCGRLAALDWLLRRNRALGDRRPIAAPAQDVLDLIGRIEHGVFS